MTVLVTQILALISSCTVVDCRLMKDCPKVQDDNEPSLRHVTKLEMLIILTEKIFGYQKVREVETILNIEKAF